MNENDQQNIQTEEINDNLSNTASAEKTKAKSFFSKFLGKIKSLNKVNNGKWQAFKYLLCTASAGLIELISFTILKAILVKTMGLEQQTTFIVTSSTSIFIATTVALALSVLWNFTLNRKITFKAANNVPKAMFLAFLFYVPFYPFKIWFNGVLPGMAVANAAAAAGLTSIAYLTAHSIIITAFEIISMLCNGILEFCWQKFFIYRKSINTAVSKHDKEIEREEQLVCEGAHNDIPALEKIDDIQEIELTEEDKILKE